MRFKKTFETTSNTDVLKLLAVVIMVIDHLGYIFFLSG